MWKQERKMERNNRKRRGKGEGKLKATGWKLEKNTKGTRTGKETRKQTGTESRKETVK